ncbi:hypothetical protein THAOC_10665, partial [Thalassiosira oceanica]
MVHLWPILAIARWSSLPCFDALGFVLYGFWYPKHREPRLMADPSDSQTRLNFHSAASSQTASRKRRREHRVRVGGKRIKTQTSASNRSARPQDQTDKTLNRKRSAKSLTDRDPSMRSLREMYSGHGAKRKKKWKENTPS